MHVMFKAKLRPLMSRAWQGLSLSAVLAACAHTPEPPTALIQEPLSGEISDLQAPVQADSTPVFADLWARVRYGFTLPPYSVNPRIKRFIKWHQCRPDYLQHVTTQAEPFLHFIVEAITERGLPTELVLLPIVESAYSPFAYSRSGAAGLWQFIPKTGTGFGLKQTWWYDARRDIHASTRAALDYLTQLNQQFAGDWLLTLAAYNAGPTQVATAIAKNQRRGQPTDYWHLDLPRETEEYVPKFLALKEIVKDPEALSIDLWPVADTPYLALVDLEGQLDLALAAELADMELDKLYDLNPGFNQWMTSPSEPHLLLLPLDRADTFKARLTKLPPAQRVTWSQHRVRSGESLTQIARRYQTSPSLLEEINQLSSGSVRAGQDLVVPRSAAALKHYSLFLTHRRKRIPDTSQASKLVYVVRRGDSLSKIARTYAVSARELARWNGMSLQDTLKSGDRLVVRRDPRKTRPVKSLSTAVQKVHYQVKRGDSLFAIARRFQVSVPDLRKWNKLKGDVLKPGQSMIVRSQEI